MTEAKGPLVVGNRLAAVGLAPTVALLIAILLVSQEIVKNLLIGLMGGPVIWMLHLLAGTGPRIERPTFLRAAAGVILIFTAFLVTLAEPPLPVLFFALVAWGLVDAQRWPVWRWVMGGKKRGQR